jgi:hypothetical protein
MFVVCCQAHIRDTMTCIKRLLNVLDCCMWENRFVQYIVIFGDGAVRPEVCGSWWFLLYDCNFNMIM